MRTPTRILLADDGTPVSSGARHAAADLARQWRAELHVVTVRAENTTVTLPALGDLERRCAGDRTVLTHHLISGGIAEQIAMSAVSIDAGLVIMGSHRLHGATSAGSVGRAVVNATTTPVLIARGDTWPPQRIVVGDDGSDEAHAAMELAADIGRGFGARALLVDAMPELSHPGHDPARRMQAASIASGEADRIAGDSIAMRQRLGGSATGVLSYASPAQAIRQTADDAARVGHVLIAVGSSGKSDFDRLMGWSVSARAVDVEGVSVLVVPRAWAVAQKRDLAG